MVDVDAAPHVDRRPCQVGVVHFVKSPNALDPSETFTAFLFSVVAGARCFAHTPLVRADCALHALLGIARFPSDSTMWWSF